MDDRTITINRLSSTLFQFISEWDKEKALEYFSALMLDAKIDSEIVVEVLEKFGEEGKEEARAIKVNEGW